jgi:hypothetical protein
MERDELMKLMKTGPLKIRMNDGETYEIAAQSEAVVSDIAAYVLYRRADGRLKTMVLPLLNISGVEELARS